MVKVQILINFYETFPLEVETSTKVQDIKKLIEVRNGVKPELQLLIFGGVQLETEKCLSEYNIEDNSRIDVVPVYPAPETDVEAYITFHRNCEEWMRSILACNGTILSDSKKWKEMSFGLTTRCVEKEKEINKCKADLSKAVETKSKLESQCFNLIEGMEMRLKTVEGELAEMKKKNIVLEQKVEELTKINDMKNELKLNNRKVPDNESI